MKMKKSKLLIPAIGMLVFTSAASVSGTVAWFTANQVFTMNVGDFAVVNTKDNLQATLTPVIGTALAGNAISPVKVNEKDAVLTDGTVDHTNTTKPTIIAPTEDGQAVGKIVDFDIGTAQAADLTREANIYTAFTWDITFSVVFSSTQTNKLGLFLDLSDSTTSADDQKSYVRVKEIGDNVKTAPADTYYTAPSCLDSQLVTEGVTLTNGTAYYKKATAATGAGFRIAFIPKTVPAGCLGVTKVWGDLQTKAKMAHIDLDRPAAFSTGSSYDANALVYKDNAVYKALEAVTAGDWDAAKWAPAALDDYDQSLATATATTQLVNGTWSAATVGAGMVAMDSASTSAIPANGNKSSITALSGSDNYLGYFAKGTGDNASMTITCVAYYEGTDETIVNTASTVYETVVSKLTFGLSKLSD